MRWTNLFRLSLVTLSALVPRARGQLVQVREDFSRDPGWDHYQNRIVGTGMPAVRQDFGWRPTNHTGRGPGEVGGRVENSRRQAYYAMPLGKPLSFDDEISASGTLALRHIETARRSGVHRLLQLLSAYVAGLELAGVPGLGGGRRPGPGDVRLDVERLARARSRRRTP